MECCAQIQIIFTLELINQLYAYFGPHICNLHRKQSVKLMNADSILLNFRISTFVSLSMGKWYNGINAEISILKYISKVYVNRCVLNKREGELHNIRFIRGKKNNDRDEDEINVKEEQQYRLKIYAVSYIVVDRRIASVNNKHQEIFLSLFLLRFILFKQNRNIYLADVFD